MSSCEGQYRSRSKTADRYCKGSFAVPGVGYPHPINNQQIIQLHDDLHPLKHRQAQEYLHRQCCQLVVVEGSTNILASLSPNREYRPPVHRYNSVWGTTHQQTNSSLVKQNKTKLGSQIQVRTVEPAPSSPEMSPRAKMSAGCCWEICQNESVFDAKMPQISFSMQRIALQSGHDFLSAIGHTELIESHVHPLKRRQTLKHPCGQRRQLVVVENTTKADQQWRWTWNSKCYRVLNIKAVSTQLKADINTLCHTVEAVPSSLQTSPRATMPASWRKDYYGA